MNTITCPRCGFSFETAAKANTQDCGNVVDLRESADQLWEVGLLLVCGHANWTFDWDERPDSAVKYRWKCQQCKAEDQEALRALGAVRAEEANYMDHEQLMAALLGEYATVGSGSPWPIPAPEA